MTTVNFSEVLGRFVRDGHDATEVAAKLGALRFALIDFDRELARLAASLLPRTTPLGLSIGDRACLALALARGSVAVTADRVWIEADLPVAVELIR